MAAVAGVDPAHYLACEDPIERLTLDAVADIAYQDRLTLIQLQAALMPRVVIPRG